MRGDGLGNLKKIAWYMNAGDVEEKANELLILLYTKFLTSNLT